MARTVIKTLNNQIAGKKLLTSPTFIAVAETKFVFVSNVETHTLTQVDKKSLRFVYFTSPMLKMSFEFVFVNDTHGLVAGWESHNMLVLDTTTGYMTTLLGQTEKTHKSGAVAWRPASNTFYVCIFLVKTITKF